MKIVSEKLRCDNCKTEVPLYGSHVPGYDEPLTYHRGSWFRIHHPYTTNVKESRDTNHFCSIKCVMEWATKRVEEERVKA